MPVAHTHLDRQRRARGVCPACDLAWDRQDAALASTLPTRTVIQQLERMADKPKAKRGAYCPAIVDARIGAIHTCGKPRGHTGAHVCPICDEEWTRR